MTSSRLCAALVSAAAICALGLIPLASGASAAEPTTGYGELTRFGPPVKGGREAEAAPGELSEAFTLALGVDPEEGNSVFVLEERKKEAISGATTTRFFRLKKFTASGGKYTEAASKEFEEESPHLTSEALEGEKPGVDGLAVDAKGGKVYLLASDLRAEADTVDRGEGNGGQEAVLAASTLYGFSTSTLAEVSKTELAKTELAPQSDVAGKSLLDPQGITVDPATGEVIVLAHIDESGSAVDSIANAKDHFVLMRIKPGTGVGSTYVDKTNKLKENLEGEIRIPTSPVVVPGAPERVLVNWDGLAEVPYSFSSSEAPKALPLSRPLNGEFTEQIERGLLGVAPAKTVLEAAEARAAQGGRLAVSPEGTLFGAVKVTGEKEGKGKEAREGVLALSSANGEPIGWTGGAFSQGSSQQKNQCVVQPTTFGMGALVAAGKGGDVFVLAPLFLRQQEEEIEEEVVENPETEEFEIIETVTFGPLEGKVVGPALIEFGPGGKGCSEAEQASSEGVEDEVNGTKKVEEEKAGNEIKFTSSLKGADATKVEWVFEVEGQPTTKETVVQSAAELRGGSLAPQPYRDPSIRHKFTNEGLYKVTETVYVDDLASMGQSVFVDERLVSPAITMTLKHPLKITPSPPHAEFTFSPSEPHAGEAVNFESKSSDPNGSKALPLKYTWTFGDGTTSGPSIAVTATHAYAKAQTYTAKLTVEDALGKKAEATHTFTVAPAKETPPPPPPPPCNCTTTTETGTTTTTTTSTTPKQEVLSYSASLGGGSIAVSKSGALTIKVDCSGQSSCKGTVTLRTLKAVASGKSKHKSIVTLASGAFSAAAGHVQAVTLHLSSAARALLAKSHNTLAARATIVGVDSIGASHTTAATVTLKLVLPKAKKHH